MSEAAETPKKIIPLSEISKHSSRDDLWVAINGKVYNISKFVYEHPGGEEVLLDVAGKDATQEFEDVGHSEYAVEILDQYYVGEGNPEELKINEKPLGVAEFDSSSDSSSSAVKLFLIAAAIAAAAFYYTKMN